MNGRHDSSSSRDTPRRTEPVLGDLGQLDAGSDRNGRAAPTIEQNRPPFVAERSRANGRAPRRHRRGLWFVAAIVVLLLGGGAWAWTHQAELSALLPQTQLNTLLTRAGQALAAGNLSDSPNSARDLYEAARVLDPDNEQALAGLQNVGNAELERAKAALQRRDFDAARAALEEARSLLGGGADVAAVDQALASAVLHSANIDVLIDQARTALANGDIDGSDGAAALFGKVLAGDPRNAVAQHGMDQVGDLLASRIQTQLGNADRAGAKQTLTNLAGLLPGYAQLPSLRAAVDAADRAADAQRDQDLAQGETDLRAGKFTGNDTDNALAQFKAALVADPGNAQAQAGLGEVAAALIAQANAALDAGHPQDAETLLDQAATLAPNSADLAAARSRLSAGGAQDSASVSSATAAGTLTPAQSAKVARLVARAADAARRGDIMLPPGDSAYDLYRAALGIDGDNAAAQAGLRTLPQITSRQFRQALGNGDLDHAGDMLATLEQLDPGDPVAMSMQHDLGSAWLDRADRDARLGDAAAARTALQEAQRLVPQDPRIGEVGARIRHEN